MGSIPITRSLREWLSWWSATLPRSRPRVRVPSRALKETQKDGIRLDTIFFVFSSPAGTRRFEVSASLRSLQSERPQDVLQSPLRFGRCKANVHRMFCSLRSASVIAKRTSTGRSATSRALKETRKNSENTQRILRVFVTRTKISQRKTKCFAY